MAEAATIIQLVQFSAAVLSCCFSYIQKAKSAPAEITAIIDETTSFKNLLEQLQAIANNPIDERFAILKSHNRPNGAFANACAALAELDAKTKTLTEASGLRKRMQWPLESRGIEKILEKLSALKADLYLALTGDVGREVADIHDAVDDVKGTLEDMKAAEEKQTILHWLGGLDPSVIYNNAKSKRESGTCEWLIKSNDFQTWCTTGGTLMWLHASPGAGKTFLSTAVIEHLQCQPLNAEYTLVYYYFDFRDSARQTLMGLLRSLLHQICSRVKPTPERLRELHQECHGSSPNEGQLLDALSDLLRHAFRAFIVIDALDESPESDDGERRKVLDALDWLKALQLQNLSIYVASRPEVDIKDKMKDICDIDIDVQSASTNEDIRLHIRTCLSNKADKLYRWSNSPLKVEIEERLMQKAGGMFRWAACQLAELRKCLKPARIRAELENLPKTLDETYARILDSVPEMYHAELRTALIYLAFSIRPLTIQEVAEATAINVHDQSFSIEDRFGDAYDLLEVCSSLVSTTELAKDSDSAFRKEGYWHSHNLYNKPHIRVLQFAHFSVKEYLLAARTQDTLPEVFRINAALSHNYITQTCLVYLLDFNGGKRLVQRDYEQFPLLPYSALYWATHMNMLESEDREPVQELLLKLFDPKNGNHLLNLLNLYDPQHWRNELSMGAAKRSTKDFNPPLYYASYYGLLPVMGFLLETLEHNEVRMDVLNISLSGAAAGGQADAIGILLSAGADPTSSMSGDLLRFAADAGNPAAVKKLIDAGALIHGGDAYEGDALHAACVKGQADIVRLLLDYGFDISKRSQRYGTPLSAALQRDHEDIVKLLLANGADVNYPAEGYWNPLAMASENASPALVKLLLDKGAKIAPRTNPLAKAAERGEVEIVKLLLKHGAGINDFTDDFYGTALKGAIQSRNPDLLEFVLREGADIHQRGGVEMYPVDMAVFAGNVAAAQRLLELGASFSHKAMEEAVEWDQKYPLIKIMLAQGADPNAEHERYGTILQHTIFNSADEPALWLLDAGADPNGIPSGECGTPLQLAAQQCNHNLVQLLLERGAEINPERFTGYYGDPLCAAIRNNDEVLIKLFLDRGAAIDRIGDQYDPPLHCAAVDGSETTVKLLIESGASINAVSGNYGTALRAALAFSHDDVAKVLLDRGADFRTPYKCEHSTAFYKHSNQNFEHTLEVAVATNNTSTVQVLLDHGLDLNENEPAAIQALKYALQMPGTGMFDFLISKDIDISRFGPKALSLRWWASDCELLSKIKVMLSKGARLPSTDNYTGHPLLLACVDRQQWDLFDFLLEAGCDPNATDDADLHGSPLNHAVDDGQMEAITKLLAKGADVNLHAGYWGSPFVNAIAKGDEELYRLFLDHGANINSSPTGNFGSPLDTAISKGYYDIANDLIDRGADVRGPSNYGSLLTPACRSGGVGQLVIIKRLLSLGCDVNAEDKWRPAHDSVSKGNHLYETPLQAAVRSRAIDLIELMLDHGAEVNPNQPQGTYGYPLQVAAYHVLQEQTKWLLDRGADVNAVGGKYGTALQAAAKEVSDGLIKILLDAGADPSFEGGYYGSALQASSMVGIIRHVKLFLDMGAPVNTNVGKYGSPLAAAAKRAHREVVDMLLAAGADVNQAGGKYGTPLQAACCANGSNAKSHAKGIIELLIEKGAKVNTPDIGKYGSPLQAAAYHNKEYVKVLLSHGADSKAEGGKFGSALKAGQAKGAFHTERLLMRLNCSVQPED